MTGLRPHLLSATLLFLALSACVADVSTTPSARLEKACALQQDGNTKEAYELFETLCLDPTCSGQNAVKALHEAIQCQRQLNQTHATDALLEKTISAHPEDWRLLASAAQEYTDLEHRGTIIAGDFLRGHHRGGGRAVNSNERDRLRALQLFESAVDLAQQVKVNSSELGSLYLKLARAFRGWQGQLQSWRLQTLTDLTTLPDYDNGFYHHYGRDMRRAPVDEAGSPIFHALPKSYETAKSDGERWRFLLAEAARVYPPLRDGTLTQLADFAFSQFGVQTMAEYNGFFRSSNQGSETRDAAFTLDTLAEDEALARLATGIKRFTLPDDWNFIAIYQDIAKRHKNGDSAINRLAKIFENRRQYNKAVPCWKQSIEFHGDSNGWKQKQLDQILKNWGQFESVSTFPAGQKATVEFRFRNGNAVKMEARAIRTQKLLEDVKDYLKHNPKKIEHEKVNINNIGFRLIHQNGKKYIGDSVAEWTEKLSPRPGHLDKRTTLTTPLTKAGAYLLTATMPNGNTSTVVIWITDTVIAHKRLNGKPYYFVADALTGKPIPDATVECFGYRQEYINKRLPGGRHYNILTSHFAEKTNRNGELIPDVEAINNRYQWLITATTPKKDAPPDEVASERFAFIGFTHMWTNRQHDRDYKAIKVFTITDRPVYRPNQSVKYKVWIRHAQYDKPNVSQFANNTYTLEIFNPKNEKIVESHIKTDAFGGFDGEYPLPEDATLGVYRINIQGIGGQENFRVEEYKKPEFEVTIDAPEKPIMLGDTITAKVKANYYFGAPVTEAKVKIKVLRTSHTSHWYPKMPWDWFYEPGYWWFGYDYNWYPGWRKWGCIRPIGWWWPTRHQPPEVVAEIQQQIEKDGTVSIKIDTAMAKAMHGDEDHRYEITAEVTDKSRRTIVGKGAVLVAREPFKVYTWVHRGHYRQGDTIQASFSAHTLDNKPIRGDGNVTLYKVNYGDGAPSPRNARTGAPSPRNARTGAPSPRPPATPSETIVEQWSLTTDAEGKASLQMTAATPGQYRLAYTLTDSEGHTREGAHVFIVMGDNTATDKGFRFNAIELVPNKAEYADGDKVRLRINTEQPNSTVVLFLRPSNGVYLQPQILRLDGKSTLVEIPVSKKDMPNFFVEAFTVSDGKLHTDTREIVVPPEKRILKVELMPSTERYKPGEHATIKLRLTDVEGTPFVGSTVISVYDKSVEYISGGSNVPEIRAHFWKWRRRHNPHTESNLDRHFGNIVLPKKDPMRALGAFGHLVADESQGVNSRRRSGISKFKSMGIGGGRSLSVPMVMAESTSTVDSMMADGEAARKSGEGEGGETPAMAEPTIRSEFADTAFWAASLTTDSNGLVEVEFDMPENLTTWVIKAWAMGHGTKVGEGSVDVVTTKNLLLRLQAPRFFVEKDIVVLSANIHNYLDSDKTVSAILELGPQAPSPQQPGLTATKLQDDQTNQAKPSPQQPGLTATELQDDQTDQAKPSPQRPCVAGTEDPKQNAALALPLSPLTPLTQTITIPAGGEARVDWKVRAVREGEAVIRMKALTDEESDAMEMAFPVYVHGMLKTESFSGVIRPEGKKAAITLRVPEERRIEQTRLELRYSPTLAGAMVDALPYLVSYPYGCTEQTLNRFVPTVITQRILRESGIDLAAIREKQTNLNAQEIGTDKERAAQWKHWKHDPVFDEDKVATMVKSGIERLSSMQNSDGGWGWFSGYHEHSYPHTTATIVHGLQVARKNGAAIIPGVIENGLKWLRTYQDKQVDLLNNHLAKKKPYKRNADNRDAFIFMVLVDAGITNDEMGDFLYRDRNELSVYGKSMLGMALHKLQKADRLAMMLRNIEQYLVIDDENQTAYLDLQNGGYWWCWYGSEFEAHAYYLKLLAATDPKSPKAAGLVKYLLNNRKHATYWNSTRDTALCIEALADYLRASGEDKPDMTLEIFVDGMRKKSVTINADNLFSFDNKLILEGEALNAGDHTVELRRKGTGPVYFNAYLTNFTLEDPITKAGLEIKVQRKVYRLERDDKTIAVSGSRGQALNQRVERYTRTELSNLDSVTSGDLIEVELEIESKNDYEYILFEDMKAAGFEPVDVRSGYIPNDIGAYVEFRDERVAFLVRQLARGKHSVSYRLRAEIPGTFSALPTRASAMYAPELKANSDEIKLSITDSE